MIDSAELARVLVAASDTLVHDFDTVEFLHTVTENAQHVSGANAVGLMLGDHHRNLQYVASSNHDGHVLEVLQLAVQEGPCPDAYRTGQPVVNTDLTSPSAPWPAFAGQAVAGGYLSVHAFPLRLRDEAVGAMALFGSDATTFSDEEVTAVQALADIATISILQARAALRAQTLTEQLQGALESRVVIEQAKGAVSMIAGVPIADAFAMLRNHARRHGKRLSDVALQTVEDPRGTASWWRN